MFNAPNPDFISLVQDKFKSQGFIQTIGFQLTTIEPGLVEGILPIKKMHLQQDGFAHGGVISTIADVVTGFAAFTLVRADQFVLTVELKTSYLNPGIGDDLKAVGKVIKAGKLMHFCESWVYALKEKEETLIARATTTMVVLDQLKKS